MLDVDRVVFIAALDVVDDQRDDGQRSQRGPGHGVQAVEHVHHGAVARVFRFKDCKIGL